MAIAGEPYLANQVVWMTAAIVVPCYQFINLCTICEKDQHWALPFQYIEGIKTGREIKLEDEVQLDRLYLKMKLNYYRSFVLQYSVIISYSKCPLGGTYPQAIECDAFHSPFPLDRCMCFRVISAFL